jgi:transcriptional regulator with XRE-family HTH domain
VSDVFGARLRQQRERLHITLEAVSARTKIKVSHLEGLERGDLSDWPGGIFRRGFIRAYATAIGLDPDAVVRECQERHPEPEPIVPDEPEDMPSTRLGFLLRAGRESIERLRPAASEAVPPAPAAAAEWTPDLVVAAQLCTDLARLDADQPGQVEPLLREAARILNAAGVVVWVWQPKAATLKAAWAHGYPEVLVARLPTVRPDAENVTAAAFRSGQTCVVNSGDGATGAVTAPLPTPDGCVGVLAMEFRNGDERRDSTQALAAMFAALLGRAVLAAQPVATVDRRLA